MSTQRAYAEPTETEDPRNLLLETMASQIIDHLDTARRNDCLAQLIARIEAKLPSLAKSLNSVPSHSPVPAPASCGSPENATSVASARGIAHTTEIELRLSKVMAALKLGHPKTPAARDLLDGAKMIVLSELAALRAARSLIVSRPPAETRLASTPARDEHADRAWPFMFAITDVGSGE